MPKWMEFTVQTGYAISDYLSAVSVHLLDNVGNRVLIVESFTALRLAMISEL